jgi:hypothetical protein
MEHMRFFPQLSNRWRLFKRDRGIARAEAELTSRSRQGQDWIARPHGLPRGLTVSLTSYPKRYETLSLTLQCLLLQTARPDRVVLWLAKGDEDALPTQVKELRPYGLEIRTCTDTRSYKKIIPSLTAFPDDFIVTADDDVYYWPTWLEELIEAWHAYPGTAISHRAHRITLNSDGLPLPYIQWDRRIRHQMRSPLLLPTGVLGVLYDPKQFHPDVSRADLFMELAGSADDIWLWWMHRLCASCPQTLANGRVLEWHGSQVEQLQALNVHEGVNDTTIAAMIKRYGFPAPDEPTNA